MSDYRRARMLGATYFFTLATFNRRPILCRDEFRSALRTSTMEVRQKRPFGIEGWALLPDHLHCLWTLRKDDTDYSTRWSLIKRMTSWRCRDVLRDEALLTDFKRKYRESTLWQRRFWEHAIRDEGDFSLHLDYIHYNPVKHGLCQSVKDWPYSTFMRYVDAGIYSLNWATGIDLEDDVELGE